MGPRGKLLCRGNVYFERARGKLCRGECSRLIASKRYPDEHHSGIVLVGYTKSRVKSQDRGECEVFLCNNDSSEVQFLIILPLRLTGPCSECVFDPLISMHIGPAIHRDFELWKSPDKIASPIEMII